MALDAAAVEKIAQLARLGIDPADMKEDRVALGTGCDECFQSGYAGRTAIYEFLPVDETLRTEIMEGATADQNNRLQQQNDRRAGTGGRGRAGDRGQESTWNHGGLVAMIGPQKRFDKCCTSSKVPVLAGDHSTCVSNNRTFTPRVPWLSSGVRRVQSRVVVSSRLL